MSQKTHYVIGGGTISHVRSHLALCAPAYGGTARAIHALLVAQGESSRLQLTKMADPTSKMETSTDVAALVEQIKNDPCAGIVFFNPAIVDFNGHIGTVPSGKYAERMKSREAKNSQIILETGDKIVSTIRKDRKDIFLVAFKTTTGASEDEQYESGLTLLKSASVNLVLANDTLTRKNMIIVPEEARYHVTTNRQLALSNLVEMATLRSNLHYTRSTVIDGPRVNWHGPEIPAVLRTVVDHCIAQGAYKAFHGKTAGHFAARGARAGEFLTSARKENFNQLAERGLVRVMTDGPDSVMAVGAKPSVGGQSQRIIFNRNPDLDCIVHFHAPMRPGSNVNVRSQRPFECGSHECGENTADGLRPHADGIHAVMLDNHGPNIVFGRNADPTKIIRFIDDNFDLSQKTGGIFKHATPAP